jgi:hypothetical protein
MNFLNIDASMQDLNEAYMLVNVGEAAPRPMLMPCVALSNSNTLHCGCCSGGCTSRGAKDRSRQPKLAGDDGVHSG